jgi:hypothetical protein
MTSGDTTSTNTQQARHSSYPPALTHVKRLASCQRQVAVVFKVFRHTGPVGPDPNLPEIINEVEDLCPILYSQ